MKETPEGVANQIFLGNDCTLTIALFGISTGRFKSLASRRIEVTSSAHMEFNTGQIV